MEISGESKTEKSINSDFKNPIIFIYILGRGKKKTYWILQKFAKISPRQKVYHFQISNTLTSFFAIFHTFAFID
jgi:hypothetical protein